jgi:hypothetical protein
MNPNRDRVNKKVHSLWLDFWAPPGVNIAPWGRSPCGNVAHHDSYALHRWRPIIALAGERAQPTATAERAVFLLPLAGRLVRGGADDPSQRRLRNAVAGGLTRASMWPPRPRRRAANLFFGCTCQPPIRQPRQPPIRQPTRQPPRRRRNGTKTAQVPGAAVRAGLRRLRGGCNQRREHEPGREPPRQREPAGARPAALRGTTLPRRRRRRRAHA